MEIPDKFPETREGEPWNHRVARILITCAALAYESKHTVDETLRGNRTFQWFAAENRVAETEAFAIATDHEVVLAFRGTAGLKDVISDVQLSRSHLKHYADETKPLISGRQVIKAHDGFRRCLDVVWTEESHSRIRAHQQHRKIEGPTVRDFEIGANW